MATTAWAWLVAIQYFLVLRQQVAAEALTHRLQQAAMAVLVEAQQKLQLLAVDQELLGKALQAAVPLLEIILAVVAVDQVLLALPQGRLACREMAALELAQQLLVPACFWLAAVAGLHGQVALGLAGWVVLAVEMDGQTQPQEQMERPILAAVVEEGILQQEEAKLVVPVSSLSVTHNSTHPQHW